MKNFIQSFLFLAVFVPCKFHAQIEISKEKEIKNTESIADTTPKKQRPERKNVDGSTEVFFSSAWSNSYRKLIPNEDFLPKELGIRADEAPLKIWSYGVGFRSYVHKHIVFEGGLSLLRNGESYSFKGEDSTFTSKSIYTYVSVPIRLQYVIGDQIRFFAGGSFFPEIINRYKETSEWTNSKNETKSIVSKDKQALNSMVFSAGLNAGVQAKLGKYMSVFVMPEYRWQLTSSYTKLNYYKHFARVFSVNFGLIYQL